MTILFWLYRSRINKTGTVPIMMRITVNGKRISFTTKLFVEPTAWDQDKQRIKGNSPLTIEYNKLLLTFNSRAWNAFNDVVKRNIPIEAKTIRDIISNKNTQVSTLVEAIQYHLGNLKARSGFDISANTVKKYKTLDKKMKGFLSIQLKRSDVSLYEVNRQFVSEFDLYMRTIEKLKHNAVVKNMQQLRHVIKVCLQNEWMEKDPFSNYSLKLNYTERGYLSLSEVIAIQNIVLPNKRLDQTRDIFLFCCYTGLAYADVSKLHQLHLETDSNGIGWIRINRTKTKSRSVIPVLPVAKMILAKYHEFAHKNRGLKLLPVISNQNLNKYLKEVATICGINKRVSLHLARHTFATTITLEKGVDIVTIAIVNVPNEFCNCRTNQQEHTI
jgi:site-specific recombinase XerD